MKIEKRRDEEVSILALTGKLIIGDGDVAMREAISAELDAGVKKILLDLGGVKALDSSGLGELVRCKASAESQSATIRLLHVEDKVQEILEMTRLIGIFDTYDDPIDAIASFRD